MDLEEAKYLLQSYRPSGKDADDPHFSEALALTQSNPELQGWFARQQGISRAIESKFKEIPVPKDLRNRILTGQIERENPRQWTFGHTLAAAAIVLILLTPIAYFANRFEASGPQTFAAMKIDMGNYLSRFFVLEMQSSQIDEIQGYLQDEQNFPSFEVPDTLAKYPGIGCQLIDWHDENIALICFNVDGEVVHLFVLEPTSLDTKSIGSIPEFEQIDRWATYTWTDKSRAYFVSTLGNKAFLTRVLKPKRAF